MPRPKEVGCVVCHEIISIQDANDIILNNDELTEGEIGVPVCRECLERMLERSGLDRCDKCRRFTYHLRSKLISPAREFEEAEWMGVCRTCLTE